VGKGRKTFHSFPEKRGLFPIKYEKGKIKKRKKKQEREEEKRYISGKDLKRKKKGGGFSFASLPGGEKKLRLP